MVNTPSNYPYKIKLFVSVSAFLYLRLMRKFPNFFTVNCSELHSSLAVKSNTKNHRTISKIVVIYQHRAATFILSRRTHKSVIGFHIISIVKIKIYSSQCITVNRNCQGFQIVMLEMKWIFFKHSIHSTIFNSTHG